MKFKSLIDSRFNADNINLEMAYKFWLHHENMFGRNKCLIEEDGIELDPVEIFHLNSQDFVLGD